MFENVLIVTSTILVDVQSSREFGCYLDLAYQQAMIKSGIPYTRCVRINVDGETDQCPTVQVNLGISSHTEAFCVRWNNESNFAQLHLNCWKFFIVGQEVHYRSPLQIHDTIECQCSVHQRCNGNFPAILQTILGGAPSLRLTDFECIRASVTHQVMMQQIGQTEATTTAIRRKSEKTSRTKKKTTDFLIKSSRTSTTKSTSPKPKTSPSTLTKRAAPTKPSTTERKVKETTTLPSSTRTTISRTPTSAAPEIERTTSLVTEHVLVTDATEDLTTTEHEGLAEAKEQENISKERRRKISLHLLMLSLFLVTLSVSHLFCMCRLREKYLRSPPEKKGKSPSIIKSASSSQSSLPGQASRRTPASLRSGKGSQKSGKKTLGYFDV